MVILVLVIVSSVASLAAIAGELTVVGTCTGSPRRPVALAGSRS